MVFPLRHVRRVVLHWRANPSDDALECSAIAARARCLIPDTYTGRNCGRMRYPLARASGAGKTLIELDEVSQAMPPEGEIAANPSLVRHPRGLAARLRAHDREAGMRGRRDPPWDAVSDTIRRIGNAARRPPVAGRCLRGNSVAAPPTLRSPAGREAVAPSTANLLPAAGRQGGTTVSACCTFW
jgi:hypothetical protein